MKNEILASLDWLPTFVDIAGGPKGNGLKAQIEKYPGIVKATLDGVNQRDYLDGKSEKSARDLTLLFRQGAVGREVQELEDVFRHGVGHTGGLIPGVQPDNWTRAVNIKRDPLETSVGQ